MNAIPGNPKTPSAFNWTRLLFGILLFVVVVAAIIFYLPIFGYLLFSLVFAYIFDPVVTWLEHKKLPRWVSIILIYLVIGGLIVWLSLTYIPRLVDEGNRLFEVLSKTDKPLDEAILDIPFIHSIQNYVEDLDKAIPNMGAAQKFETFLVGAQSRLASLPDLLVNNYQRILSTLALVFTIPIFSFFILNDKRKLRKAMHSLVPNRFFELSLILMNKVDETVGRYLRAILLEAIAVSVMSTIALTIVGVPYSVVIGIIAGITNVIPYLGPWIGGGVAAITILVTGNPPVLILWVGLAMFLVQQIDNYMVYPVVIGRTIKMHPLVVLLTVFAGGYFGGVIWMLISVPLVYMLWSLLQATYTNLKKFRLI